MPDRYVIVVPINAPDTLAYLTDSFKNVRDVDVVADRRARTPATDVPVERRASRRIQEAFGCTLVRIERTRDAVERFPAAPSHERSESLRLRDLPLLGDT